MSAYYIERLLGIALFQSPYRWYDFTIPNCFNATLKTPYRYGSATEL